MKKRVERLRQYMIDEVLDKLVKDQKYVLNANFLSNDVNNYSIDRIPIENPVVSQSIIDFAEYREVYEFRSRNSYGEDVMTNLQNIGFYEDFEDKIKDNNNKGILPEGITEIHCLGVGAINMADTKDCEFGCQIEIRWEE